MWCCLSNEVYVQQLHEINSDGVHCSWGPDLILVLTSGIVSPVSHWHRGYETLKRTEKVDCVVTNLWNNVNKSCSYSYAVQIASQVSLITGIVNSTGWQWVVRQVHEIAQPVHNPALPGVMGLTTQQWMTGQQQWKVICMVGAWRLLKNVKHQLFRFTNHQVAAFTCSRKEFDVSMLFLMFLKYHGIKTNL